MRAHGRAIVVCATLTSAGSAWATVTVELRVVPPQPVAGQPFHILYGLQVVNSTTVEGTALDMGRLRVLADPGPPRMPRYLMYGGGPGVAMTMATSVEYVAVALTPGRYTITGARAVDPTTGRVLATHPPVVLQVLAAPSGGAGAGAVAMPSLPRQGFPMMPSTGIPDPFGGLEPEPAEPVATPADPDAPPLGNLTGAEFNPGGFIRYAVDEAHPYVGQQVTLRAWLYVPAYEAGCEPLIEPGLDGFWSEPLILNREVCAQRWVPQNVSGRPMAAGLVRKIALFPTHAGRLQVGTMTMGAEYVQGDTFFGSRQRVEARSPVLPVDVREPPSEGRPVDYRPGTVGQVTLQAAVDRPTAPVGETVTVTVRAVGNGYLGSAGIPEPAPVDGLRIHPGSSEVNHSAGDPVQSTLQNEYLVVATRPGTFPMGELSVAWLDPATGRYQRTRISLPTLTATGTALARDDDDSHPDPTTELSPYEPEPSLRRHRAGFTTALGAWGTLAMPPVALALAAAGASLRRWLRARRRVQSETARTDPDALLAAAVRALRANNPSEAVALAGRALERAWKQHDGRTLDEALRARIEAVQTECDTARFSGAAGDPVALVDRVRAAIEALEAAG